MSGSGCGCGGRQVTCNMCQHLHTTTSPIEGAQLPYLTLNLPQHILSASALIQVSRTRGLLAHTDIVPSTYRLSKMPSQIDDLSQTGALSVYDSGRFKQVSLRQKSMQKKLSCRRDTARCFVYVRFCCQICCGPKLFYSISKRMRRSWFLSYNNKWC